MGWIKNKVTLAFLVLVVIGSGLPAFGSVIGYLAGRGGLGDGSYNDMAYKGAIEAKMAMNGSLLIAETDSPDLAPRAVEWMIENGASLVVANGHEYSEVLDETIKQHKGVLFVLNEAEWPGTENSMALKYDHRPASILVGALAGWVTRTGKLGFIGAHRSPVIEDFLQGFSRGVELASPDVEIIEVFLSQGPQGFNMSSRAYDVVMEMQEAGVDVVFPVAGLSANGALQAAKERGIFFIAVDSDRDDIAPGTVLVSLIKRVDLAVRGAIEDGLSGRFRPGCKTLGMREGIIELSTMKHTRDIVGDETLSKFRALELSMKSGEPAGPEGGP